MPGAAEQDIAFSLAPGAKRISAFSGYEAAPATGSSLAMRVALLMGIEFTITLSIGLLSFYCLNSSPEIRFQSIIVILSVIAVSVSTSFWERGLYKPSALLTRELQLHKLVLAWLQAIGVALLLAFCVVSVAGATPVWPGANEVTQALQGTWLPLFLFLGFIGLTGVRFARAHLAAAAVPPNRTVIVGTTDLSRDVLGRLRQEAGHPLNVIGVVEHEHESAFPLDGLVSHRTFCDLPVFGGVRELVQMIRRDQVDTVLVALPGSEAMQAREVVSRVALAPVDVYIIPGLDALTNPDRRIAVLAGLPLVLAANRPLSGWRRFLKRAEDLFFGTILLALAGPAMLGIAALVKLTSKGPVLFRQRRLGFNNRVIEVLKFRTMYAEMADADACQQTTRGDKRVTSIGGWLRRTSLDELPQLLNVLKGDMSLVGPRPHALQTTAGGLPLEDAVPTYSARHRVKPGITGWAQVNGFRGAIDTVDKIVNRVNYDLYYIENWSLALDMKILWRTTRLMVADDNAF
ncbi:MAG TPA: undecaprenyl-phosphate glucose phosphotransferase [Acetobacteraceae bacterium]|nr:undecaprenyl-phosphate glucose phosphotransferase [Acetobacteraceae bacterium]